MVLVAAVKHLKTNRIIKVGIPLGLSRSGSVIQKIIYYMISYFVHIMLDRICVISLMLDGKLFSILINYVVLKLTQYVIMLLCVISCHSCKIVCISYNSILYS